MINDKFPTRAEGFSQDNLNYLNQCAIRKGLNPLVFGNQVQSGIHTIRTNWWENSDMISKINGQYVQESMIGGIIPPVDRISVTSVFPQETSARMNVVLNPHFQNFSQSPFAHYLNNTFDFEESKVLDSSVIGYTLILYNHVHSPTEFLDNLKKIESKLFDNSF